jgi:sugar O-acyltransferase (sialic acid O-acetyltransferase NeuD family)
MNAPSVLLVFGASGHAKVVLDAIERLATYRVAGLVVREGPAGPDVFGYPVVGDDENIRSVLESRHVDGAVVAIGDNWRRHEVARSVRERFPWIAFPAIVHPSARVARGVTIGEGAVLLAGVVVNSDAAVGDFCLLNTNSSLDHDSRMDLASSLGPNAAVGGGAAIGAFSAVAMGATVLQNRHVGEHAIVGAQALVLKDIPSHTVAYGAPAKPVRAREAGEPYL